MATYVHKKQRAFRDANNVELLPRRSEGRMKTYPSATDARAWCDETEERRQHIIELIRRDIKKVRHYCQSNWSVSAHFIYYLFFFFVGC